MTDIEALLVCDSVVGCHDAGTESTREIPLLSLNHNDRSVQMQIGTNERKQTAHESLQQLASQVL